MAKNNDIRVNLNLFADTHDAKRQIQELQASLSKLGSGFDISTNLTEGIRREKPKILNEISQIQIALKKSFNDETGNLDYSVFSKTLQGFGTNAENVGKTLKSMGDSGEKTFYQLSNAIAKSEVPFKKFGETFQNLQKSFASTIRWQITSKSLNLVLDGLSQAYNYVQKLDRSLNNIRIVTGYSADKMADFAVEANAAAKALSASTVAYSDAALIFYQQGLDDKAVKERTDATIKMANVTGEMAKEVSSYMTAIWNNFDDGTKSLEYYADVITALGAATAASSEEIAEGMEKFAAIGKTVGLSYEYATAAVATVVAKTRQDADVVGTSFKTLFARLEGLSLGKTLEDGTNLNKYSQALASVGVNIKDQVGQLKDMDQILDELGNKWTLLTDDQKVALAQTVGGVRQYAQLIALMDNFDTFRENVEIASESEGTLAKQQRIFEESWKGAQRRLQASWEEFYNDIFDDKWFKQTLDFISKLVDGADTLYNSIGGIYGILADIVPLVVRLNRTNIIQGVNNAVYNARQAFGYIKNGGITPLEQERNNFRRGLINSVDARQGTVDYNKQQIELKYLEIEEKYKNSLSEADLEALNYSKELLKNEQDLLETERKRTEQLLNQNRILHQETIDDNVNLDAETRYSGKNANMFDEADQEILAFRRRNAKNLVAAATNIRNLTDTTKDNYSSDATLDIVQQTLTNYLGPNGISTLLNDSDILEGYQNRLTEVREAFNQGEISEQELNASIVDVYLDINRYFDNACAEHAEEVRAFVASKITSSAQNEEYQKLINQSTTAINEKYNKLSHNVATVDDFIPKEAKTLYARAMTPHQKTGELYSGRQLIEGTRGGATSIFKHKNVTANDPHDQFWSDINGNTALRDSVAIGALFSPQRASQFINDQATLEAFNKLRGSDKTGHSAFETIFKSLDLVEDDKNKQPIIDMLNRNLTDIQNDPQLQGTLEQKFAQYFEQIQELIKQTIEKEAQDKLNASNAKTPDQLAADRAAELAAAETDARAAAANVNVDKVIKETVDAVYDPVKIVGKSQGNVQSAGTENQYYSDKIKGGVDTPLGKIEGQIENRNKNIDIGEGFYAASQALTSFTGVVQSLSNAFMVLTDESATLGEKASAISNAVLNTGSNVAMIAANPTMSKGLESAAGAMGLQSAASLGIAGAAAAIAIAIAIAAYKVSERNIENKLEEARGKLTKNLEWSQENEEALKAIDSYEQLKNAVDDTDESLDNYHQTLVETAEALSIQNVALLEQANAWGLLEEQINEAAEALNNENLKKAKENFEIAQSLESLGIDKTNLGYKWLSASIAGTFASAGTDLDKNRLAGADLEEGEVRFLRELRGLGLNGVTVGERSFSIDSESMSEGELAQLYRFLADVQTNSALYGGDSNEFVKALDDIADNLDEVATGLEESLDAIVLSNYRSDSNNAVDSISSFDSRYNEIVADAQQQFGVTEEQALAYATQIMGEFNDATLAAEYAVIRGYADESLQSTEDVLNTYNSYSKEHQEILIRAMGANAAATRMIIDAYDDEATEVEHLQALLNDLDVSTLTQSLEEIQEFISKLKVGSVFTGSEIEDLAYKMGFGSAEQFLEAFGDVFGAVAGDKYKFTGDIESFRSQIDTYLVQTLMDSASQGVSFEDIIPEDIIDQERELQNQSATYTQALSTLTTIRDDLAAAADRYQSSATNQGYFDTAEEAARTYLGYDLDAELTEEQQAALDTVLSGGGVTQYAGRYIMSQDAVNNNLSGEAWDEYINGAINDVQAASDQNQLDLEALSWVQNYQDKYDDYVSGDKTAFQDDLVTQYTTMEELQDLYEQGFITSEKYTESLQAAAISEAELWGIDTAELEKHADALAENNQYLQGNADAAEEVALANERANTAIEDLYKNFEDYKEILKDARVDSDEYNDVMISLGDDLRNIFNYDERVGEDFITQHLEDIEKAANGDIEAVNDLQVAFAQYRLATEGIDLAGDFADVYAELQATDWDDLEIGVSMDTVPAMQSLLALMLQAGASADAIADTFNALGFTINYETDDDGKIIAGTVNSHYVGTNKRGLNAKQEKNKGSKSKKKDEKELRDEFERYYKITRQIKDQEDATERLNKAKERAYGKAKLEYLDQEADSIEREIALQKEYLDEIRGYYAGDKGNLEAFGATFDENGVLTNYEQLINAELAKYNQAVEAYNANQDEAAFESAEKRFNYFKDVLKQYDETNQLYQAELDKMTDLQNKWYDMALQKTKLKVEMEIDIDDRDLKLLEYAMDRIEKKAFATAEAMAKITESIGSTLDKQKIYQNALEEILGRHGINGIEGINGLTDDQIANLGFTQEEIDAIIEYNADLLDTQEEMDKLQDEILNGPLKAFKEWNEEFDYQEDKVKRNIDLLNQYKNIADLIYSNSSSVTQEYITSLMTNAYDSMVLGVDAARLELEANKDALAKAQASYEEAVANGAGEETLNTLNKNLREMEKAVEDSEDNMLKQTEEALQQAEELFKRAIENAKDSFKELTSVTDWDMTKFDRLKSLDDEYLDDYQKIYEFAKLTRDIENSIDDADTIRSKERLREITQEIADIEAEGREVSQYEVDALRAKYELRLAEIALEDAQNAKSTVRMNRDNEGNWSYIYTADDDNVDKARQNYEDKLYEYQKLNSEFIKSQQENFLKLEQEYTDAMQKIAEDSSLSREDKEARLQETQAYYQRMAEIMSDQLGIALNKNSELYNKDWLDYSKNTGYKISMEEEYQTKLDDTYTGHLQPSIDSATQLLAQFTEAATGDGGYLPTILNSLDEFALRQDEVLQAAGTSLSDYADSMQRTADDIEIAMDDAAAGLVEDFDTIMEKISEINAASFDGLRNSITDAIGSVNDLIAAYERLSSAASVAQNSSISASGGGLGDFTSNAVGGGGLKNGSGSSTIPNSKNNDNRSSNQKAADFLWYFYTKKDSPYGSGMWAGIKQQMYTLSRDTNELIGYLTNPRNNIQNAEMIQQYIERNRLNLGSFRNWAKQNFAQVYAANAFDTGGYTGAWGPEGRLAFLHQKELVLNAKDTENMLTMVEMVRDIANSIDLQASVASIANTNNGMFSKVNAGAQTVDQNVHIEASFPNVTNHSEIEQALSNLVNQAAQYANRKS